MDPNQITTTFIPKKPLQEVVTGSPVRSSAPTGTLLVLAIIIMVLTIASLGGLLFYNKFLESNITQLQTSITRSEKEYEPTLLADLTKLDKRLKNGSMIINQHLAISPIFDLIEQNTLKTVRFSKFDFKNSETGMYLVTLAGEADNYQSIAMQSQSFGDVAAFKGIIFSDFTLTPKNRISFNASFTVSPDILNYASAPIKPITPTTTVPVSTTTIESIAPVNTSVDTTTSSQEASIEQITPAIPAVPAAAVSSTTVRTAR